MKISAFFDNMSRNGLVVGSVTHDTWKTGVYFQGSNNKLDVLNTYGGVTSSDTRDVEPHGLVKGTRSHRQRCSLGSDQIGELWWKHTAMRTRIAPKLAWNGGCLFGWNSWYAYQAAVSYSNATAVSSFFKSNLQQIISKTKATVYINLDSFWSNLSDSQLIQFANFCHTNGQKAGIYWTPFVYWGTAQQGSNSLLTAQWQLQMERRPTCAQRTAIRKSLITGSLSIQPIPAPNK